MPLFLPLYLQHCTFPPPLQNSLPTNGKLSVLNELCVNALSMGVRGCWNISMYWEVGKLNCSVLKSLLAMLRQQYKQQWERKMLHRKWSKAFHNGYDSMITSTWNVWELTHGSITLKSLDKHTQKNPLRDPGCSMRSYWKPWCVLFFTLEKLPLFPCTHLCQLVVIAWAGDVP